MAMMCRVPSPCLSCVEHRAYPILTAHLPLAHTALTHLAHPQGDHEGFHPKLKMLCSKGATMRLVESSRVGT